MAITKAEALTQVIAFSKHKAEMERSIASSKKALEDAEVGVVFNRFLVTEGEKLLADITEVLAQYKTAFAGKGVSQ